MATVDSEKKLQKRVLHCLVNELEYIYLGDLTEIDNTPVKEDLLKKSLKKRGYSNDLITKAVNELVTKTKNQVDSLYQINMDVYSLLRYGLQGAKDSKNKRPTVHYIDWDDITKNDFYVAEEVSVLRYDGKTRKRPDVVIYVNGIALGVFELKKSSVSSGEGMRQQLTNQQRENILNFFSTAQLLFAGNEAEGLYYGTIKTSQKYYLQWKEDKNATDDLSNEIKELQSKENNRLRDGIISLCHKERFLSILHDFIIFDAGIKKIARHNQYFANIAARNRILDGKGGIIWDTQGSGKSLIMVWLTKWIIENIDNSRVVIITDREELDDQIESLFVNVDQEIYRTKSCDDLRKVLNKSEKSIICSLIHKYGHNAGKDADIEQYRKELLAGLEPGFEAKGKIIAFIDECHRTNSGKLHEAVKTLMPNAILIGFTGTPLLKADKQTSIETFGSYIHTYKFDEGVKDGVILDLRYEARDVDQDLSSPEKVDLWFDKKTQGLTDHAKEQLKRKWASTEKLYSSKQRLEKIAQDIILDMAIKPRLASERGTAILVADSILNACRYWEIFKANGFNKCAVITSYNPGTENVRTSSFDDTIESEEELKENTYKKILNGRKLKDYETEAKRLFVKEPANMKLLIVVDKLLTGFDAPSATYLYIDKSMRDHDLFQSICRVNRPDGEDKDYGYIVDYMDLFRNLQTAVFNYTSGAFDGYNAEDIEGLIKNRYDESKAEMEGAIKSLKELMSNVPEPTNDSSYIEYFCNEIENEESANRRDVLYRLTASATRGFANCCDRLSSYYGYSEDEVKELRKDIADYNKIKMMIKLASSDYIDLKPYEADMRYILDTYIKAEDSKIISNLEDMSIISLLIENTTTSMEIIDKIPGDNPAKAEIIENNIKYEIVKKKETNNVYYSKLSQMLEKIILRRKTDKLSYEEYLRQIVELAKIVAKPEKSSIYPNKIKSSYGRMALYDFLNGNVELAVKLDEAIKNSSQPDWKKNQQKQQRIKSAIYKVLEEMYEFDEAVSKTEEIYELIDKIEEYSE